MRQNGYVKRVLAGVLLGALVVGSGCASDESAKAVPVPPTGPERWEAVLLPERTAAELGGVEGAWWESRRDYALSVTQDAPILAADQWPEPARPTLDRPRYIWIPRRPETMLRFDRGR